MCLNWNYPSWLDSTVPDSKSLQENKDKQIITMYYGMLAGYESKARECWAYCIMASEKNEYLIPQSCEERWGITEREPI